tara:strand:+ start:258 stop:380 length:123 start_codon:yes stop_codon:yes gene_type:complete
MRKYGNQRYITLKKLSEASGCDINTIMRSVRILEEVMEDE